MIGVLIVLYLASLGLGQWLYYSERRRRRQAEQMLDELGPLMGFALAVIHSDTVPAPLRAIAASNVPAWLAEIDARTIAPPVDWPVH